MNKEEIINQLTKIDIEKEKYIVIEDAAMVLRNIKKEAKTITINTKTPYSYNSIVTKNIKDISYTLIEGYLVQTIDSLYNTITNKKDRNLLELEISKTNNHFIEDDLLKNKYTLICGVDEVGRGPLIGPVIAAAVILPNDFKLKGLTDSKKLSEKKRIEFDKIIREKAIAYSIGIVDNNTIDEINIYEASKKAMCEAIKKLKIKPDFIITDAMDLNLNIKSKSYIKGDIKSITISAASVIAKVYRDNLMTQYDKIYPGYNLDKNKGYPTKEHFEAIKKYGITDLHRKSYKPVKDYINNVFM